ncbi:MAG: hypothetical protein WCE44_14560 [Candidatus Velthaea sp.]|jgi:hypothetical protein
MSAIIAFVVRLVGYALIVGIPARLAEWIWQQKNLDTVDELQTPHSIAFLVLGFTPFVLALFGFGRLRNLAVFIALALDGAVLTAPFAFARLVSVGVS